MSSSASGGLGSATEPANTYTRPSRPKVAPAPMRAVGMSAIGSQLGGPLAGSHFCAAHDAVTQSRGALHAEPTAHAGQLPPQSTSVSSPSWMPLVQLAPSTSPM